LLCVFVISFAYVVFFHQKFFVEVCLVFFSKN